MKRALVQFDQETYRKLRQRAFRQQRSIASLVREMVSKGLDESDRRAPPARASEFLSVRAGRSKAGRRSAVSEKHDAALADAFKK
jgi:plasmid stability protein